MSSTDQDHPLETGSPDSTSELRAARIRRTLTLVFAVIILIPSMLGFAAKFIEFINTFRDETGGVFAITPMVNYLLASIGFFCLLIWASMNGMFHDIEQPKYAMLQQEHELDQEPSIDS